MRSIIIFLVSLQILSYVLCDPLKAKLVRVHANCVAKTGVDEELVRRANEGDFADDFSLNEYLRCLMLDMDNIDDKGIFDVEKTVNNLCLDKYKAVYEKPIRKCAKEVDINANQIEVARNLCQCIQRNVKYKQLFTAGLQTILMLYLK